MGPGVAGISAQSLTKQMTPTYQASLTWVKGNHTFKFGSEVREFGYPLLSLASTNGTFGFSANQTAQPYAQSSTIGGQTVGFPIRQLPAGFGEQRYGKSARGPANGEAFHRFVRAGFLEDHS